MKILGIETSCDETAVCVVEADGGTAAPHFSVLGDALYSQVKIHEKYGGVFPALAKREHALNIPHLLVKALGDAGLLKEGAASAPAEMVAKVEETVSREPGLFEELKKILEMYERPEIDAIAVTAGPGLEPALWVGINFALALGFAWNIPVYPSNHMEGHIVSPLIESKTKVEFPALALLISGGHTELVLMKDWLTHEVIGRTRDDAVGEAFDKVARLLSLPYPGGPHISRLAAEARKAGIVPSVTLPRPMLKSPDFDFSFSGIKTAVLYALKKLGDITDAHKLEYALEFENAVTEVFISKTKKAIETHGARTLILGGGVAANSFIRQSFENLKNRYADLQLLVPQLQHSTDNAVMIAAAGYIHIISGTSPSTHIVAEGNLSL